MGSCNHGQTNGIGPVYGWLDLGVYEGDFSFRKTPFIHIRLLNVMSDTGNTEMSQRGFTN